MSLGRGYCMHWCGVGEKKWKKKLLFSHRHICSLSKIVLLFLLANGYLQKEILQCKHTHSHTCARKHARARAHTHMNCNHTASSISTFQDDVHIRLIYPVGVVNITDGHHSDSKHSLRKKKSRSAYAFKEQNSKRTSRIAFITAKWKLRQISLKPLVSRPRSIIRGREQEKKKEEKVKANKKTRRLKHKLQLISLLAGRLFENKRAHHRVCMMKFAVLCFFSISFLSGLRETACQGSSTSWILGNGWQDPFLFSGVAQLQ